MIFKSRKKNTQESNVEWTGPSVRVKDVDKLLKSDSMKRDIQAIQELKNMGHLR